jgi:hypothetical protein
MDNPKSQHESPVVYTPCTDDTWAAVMERSWWDRIRWEFFRRLVCWAAKRALKRSKEPVRIELPDEEGGGSVSL